MTDPVPNGDDWGRAKLMAEGMAQGGMALAPDAVKLLARGIAVARTGGDVRAFLQREAVWLMQS